MFGDSCPIVVCLRIVPAAQGKKRRTESSRNETRDSNASPTAFFHLVMNSVSEAGSCFEDAVSAGAQARRRGQRYPVVPDDSQSHLCHHCMDVHLPRTVLHSSEPRHDLVRHVPRDVVFVQQRRHHILHRGSVMRQVQRDEVVEQELQNCVQVCRRDRPEVACNERVSCSSKGARTRGTDRRGRGRAAPRDRGAARHRSPGSLRVRVRRCSTGASPGVSRCQRCEWGGWGVTDASVLVPVVVLRPA